MPKEVSDKKQYLVCEVCERAKSIKSYATPSQVKKRLCNYCRDYKYYGDDRKSVTRQLAKTKRVTCLKCETEFNGRINVRICGSCKEKDSYKDDAFIDFITADLTLGASA